MKIITEIIEKITEIIEKITEEIKFFIMILIGLLIFALFGYILKLLLQPPLGYILIGILFFYAVVSQMNDKSNK